MNTRIQEFCIEATTYTQIWAAGLGEVTPLEWKDTYNKKFAELIVRECAELIDNKVTITAAQTYDEVFVAKFDTKELCAKQIREHFGVEE